MAISSFLTAIPTVTVLLIKKIATHKRINIIPPDTRLKIRLNSVNVSATDCERFTDLTPSISSKYSTRFVCCEISFI